MSYILEALKKAQAERQLGNAPTIHAPQPVQVAATAADGVGTGRKPLLVGLGAGALVVLAGAALLWQRAPAPGPVPAAQSMRVAALPSAPVQPPASSVNASANAASAASGSAASGTLAVRAPDAPPAPVMPRMPEAHSPAASARVGGGGAARSAAVQPPAAASPASAAAAPAAAPVARAGAPEDGLPLLQQLPESVQSQVPRVSFGGYMYSANPADRLVLIDKGLRHEGEEVAPGLVLEKLLPHAAVMNFRGTRYRVAY